MENKEERKLAALVYKIFVIYVPIAVLVLVGLFYLYRFYIVPSSIERERIFFGLDIAMASFAGLAFYASYASKDEKRKSDYYYCAEQFFHSAVLLVLDTFLQGVIILMDKFGSTGLSDEMLTTILTASIMICFIFALISLLRGLDRLLHTFLHVFSR